MKGEIMELIKIKFLENNIAMPANIQELKWYKD